MDSRWVDPASIAEREGPSGGGQDRFAASETTPGATGQAERGGGIYPNVHSVVTDRTMTMAIRKGISLVMRQNRPVFVEVPA